MMARVLQSQVRAGDHVMSSPVRTRILEAAERIVREMGATHLTLDLVADLAAVSKGGLLYHFTSKESLLNALAERYLQGVEQCIKRAREAFGDSGDAGGLKARILGLLADDPRARALGAALLGTFVHSPALRKPIRELIASDLRQLAGSAANFSRAAIVTLAIDGLMLRESMGISSFTKKQREALVEELMRLADESYGCERWQR